MKFSLMPKFLLLSALIMFAGCELGDSEVRPDQSDIDSRSQHVSTSDVYNLNGEIVGTSQLVRKPNSISMTLQTSGLVSGNAYTVWYLVFNNPSECGSTPCGNPDLNNVATGADLMYAAGNIAGNGDHTSFAGSLQVDDNSTSVTGFFGALFGVDIPSPGLIDPMTAEIQLVVRSHGEVFPEYMPDMISTFNGGCLYPPVVPQDYGIEGVNTCEDVQISFHLP